MRYQTATAYACVACRAMGGRWNANDRRKYGNDHRDIV